MACYGVKICTCKRRIQWFGFEKDSKEIHQIRCPKCGTVHNIKSTYEIKEFDVQKTDVYPISIFKSG
jgi:hypothetical protein